MNDLHQYTRIPLGRAFALSLLITLCGQVVIEIPEMLLLPQIYADRSYYPSALQFVLDPIYFGGFILVIPLAAALPYTNSFVMRLKTGNWYYAMIRCGKKRYLQKECLSAFIRGGGGVALGFVTYTILCNMLFLPSNPQKYTSHILPFDDTIYEQMYQSAGGIPMYLYLTTVLFLCAGCWSLVALATAVWMPDPLIAVTAPLILYYLWLWGGVRQTWLVTAISPTALFNDQLTLPKMLGAMVQYLTLGVASDALFRIGAKRRMTHAQ